MPRLDRTAYLNREAHHPKSKHPSTDVRKSDVKSGFASSQKAGSKPRCESSSLNHGLTPVKRDNSGRFRGSPSTGSTREGSQLSPKQTALRSRWLSAKKSAEKLDCSTSSINRRAVPWTDRPVPYRFRYLLLVWDPNGDPERRYYEEDLENVLFEEGQIPVHTAP
jgi:hypothetical protein